MVQSNCELSLVRKKSLIIARTLAKHVYKHVSSNKEVNFQLCITLII